MTDLDGPYRTSAKPACDCPRPMPRWPLFPLVVVLVVLGAGAGFISGRMLGRDETWGDVQVVDDKRDRCQETCSALGMRTLAYVDERGYTFRCRCAGADPMRILYINPHSGERQLVEGR